MVGVGPLSNVIGVEATLVGASVLCAASLGGALAVRDFRELRRLDEEPVTAPS
jgi:hypothetical protein